MILKSLSLLLCSLSLLFYNIIFSLKNEKNNERIYIEEPIVTTHFHYFQKGFIIKN